MLRTISIALAGAMLAGCESTGVQGTMAYRGDVEGNPSYRQEVSGNRSYQPAASGEAAYRTTPTDETVRTTTVTRDDAAARPAAAAKTDIVTIDGNKPSDPAAAAAVVADLTLYPKDLKASDDLRATAVVDPTYSSIKIANASDRDLRNVTIWIDGKYAAQIGQVPARGTVTIQRSDLVNRDGAAAPVADLKNAARIQLQTRDNLYNLQGPVFDNR